MSASNDANANSKLATQSIKPKLRGWSHGIAAFGTVFAGLWLASAAKTPSAALASAAFTGSLFVLFSVSGLYHSVTWTPETRKWWRRADHAAIFVLIAGTYTPICLLALQGDLGRKLLIVVWTGAGLGVVQSLFWVSLPKAVTACLYLALGWVAARYKNEILSKTGYSWGLLIVAGGVFYSLGAFAYMLKWPNPRPAIFGYHEVFHLFVILAASVHFVAISELVLDAESSRSRLF